MIRTGGHFVVIFDAFKTDAVFRTAASPRSIASQATSELCYKERLLSDEDHNEKLH